MILSQYNGIGNPFPTKEQFRVYKLMQQDRINKGFNLTKKYLIGNLPNQLREIVSIRGSVIVNTFKPKWA